jgi:hypothetical protein
VGGEKFLDLTHPCAQAFERFVFAIRCWRIGLGGIARAVAREQLTDRLLQLLLLLLKIGLGAAPLLGGVRGQFESIDGEEVSTSRNSLTTSSCEEEMSSLIVVQCGWVSAESAIMTTFSRQRLSMRREETTPRE